MVYDRRIVSAAEPFIAGSAGWADWLAYDDDITFVWASRRTAGNLLRLEHLEIFMIADELETVSKALFAKWWSGSAHCAGRIMR